MRMPGHHSQVRLTIKSGKKDAPFAGGADVRKNVPDWRSQ